MVPATSVGLQKLSAAAPAPLRRRGCTGQPPAGTFWISLHNPSVGKDTMSTLHTPTAPEAAPFEGDLPLSTTSTYSTRDRWLVLSAAFLGWMFDGLEMGIFPQIARSALSPQMLGFDATTAAAVVEETRKW